MVSASAVPIQPAELKHHKTADTTTTEDEGSPPSDAVGESVIEKAETEAAAAAGGCEFSDCVEGRQSLSFEDSVETETLEGAETETGTTLESGGAETETAEKKVESAKESVDRAIAIETAEAYKDKGNVLFKSGLILEALEAYSHAIDVLEKMSSSSSAVLVPVLCNRALCNIKLENYGSAISDGSRALALTKNTNAKAYFRRASAYLCLANYDLAIKDFRAASRLCPNDQTTTARLKAAEKLYKAQKFAEAIKHETGPTLSQRLRETLDVCPKSLPGYFGVVYDPSQFSEDYFNKFLQFLKNPNNRFARRYAVQVVLDILDLFQKYPNVVNISVPENSSEVINVCGDTHGQFYDLLTIFAKGGMPSPKNRYLFNGDFVDRGSFSCEVILSLYMAKLIWPDYVFLSRGNHESRKMTSLYGFKGEMVTKYDETIYELFCESFDWLPLAHVINDRIFVVHGGLSTAYPDTTIKDINALERYREPDDGLLSDLLWADPQDQYGSSPSKRGVSTTWGPDFTQRFLANNKFECVIRSHEFKTLGWEQHHNKKVITIFSAPNYCDNLGNKGAFIKYTGTSLSQPQFVEFSAVPHPAVKSMTYANPLLSMM